MDNNWKNENDFRIFPNPVNSILNIESTNKQLNKILIYDLLGNKAEEMSYSNQINISNLPNGVYFLNIYANNDLIAIKKIVVCTN
ncbi:MAG: T9SS type A sorting domain-containing protein [Bacteroidetes bacterium]|nr:T9SS type A sorting domain-containing protein [Bacteroidota bacterium]